MRRIGLAALLICAASSAWSAAPALRQQMLQAPGWVNQQASGAQVAVNFQQGLYWVKGAGLQAPLSLFSITRASNGTSLLPSSASGFAYTTFGNNTLRTTAPLGILIEESRTNQLLNSAAPATQTTGSLANGTYTLWVNGSGTATMSAGTATGCGTGAASQGTAVSFTTSGAAGTCTVTVAGSLNAFQLELGPFGTSLIVTAGATATRSADSILFKGHALRQLTQVNGAIVVNTNGWFGVTAAGFSTIYGGQTSFEFMGQSASSTTVLTGTDTAQANLINATLGSGSILVASKYGLSWSGIGRSMVGNAGTVGTNANSLPGTSVTTPSLGSAVGILYTNAAYQNVSIFSYAPNNNELKWLTK